MKDAVFINMSSKLLLLSIKNSDIIKKILKYYSNTREIKKLRIKYRKITFVFQRLVRYALEKEAPSIFEGESQRSVLSLDCNEKTLIFIEDV